MCGVCGCASGETEIEDKQANIVSHHDHHHEHSHDHSHDHDTVSTGRLVQIEQDIQAKNNEYARVNREKFRAKGILALNLVSSPVPAKLLC